MTKLIIIRLYIFLSPLPELITRVFLWLDLIQITKNKELNSRAQGEFNTLYAPVKFQEKLLFFAGSQ